MAKQSSGPTRDAQRGTETARQLLFEFARRTGVTGEMPLRRYLWTDAFAVMGLLELGRRTGDAGAREIAMRLVDQVHHTLGKHRPDSGHSGWLSGLSEREGEEHPTLGGLRIGKPLPERHVAEPFDARLEWERDGQYFHYLTQWMHALDQGSRALAAPRFNLWARELARAAHAAFRQEPIGKRPGLAWKMSTDLSRPTVAATGQHDALDGFITCAELRATALSGEAPSGPMLDDELSSLWAMLRPDEWVTADALGIGGLLLDAGRAVQLVARGQLADDGLVLQLLTAALLGVRSYVAVGDFRARAEHRLAFRELGFCIGLAAIEHMRRWIFEQPNRFSSEPALRTLLAELDHYGELRIVLESFWLDEDHRQVPSWQAHRDINEVMQAGSLLPQGTLML